MAKPFCIVKLLSVDPENNVTWLQTFEWRGDETDIDSFQAAVAQVVPSGWIPINADVVWFETKAGAKRHLRKFRKVKQSYAWREEYAKTTLARCAAKVEALLAETDEAN